MKQKVYVIMEKFFVWNDKGNINMKINPHSLFLDKEKANEMYVLLDQMARNIEYYIWEGKIEDWEAVEKEEAENV